MPKPILKLDYVHNGFYRIYYKFGTYRYCFDTNWQDKIELWRCCRDGEPQALVKHLNTCVEVELPTGDNELEATIRNHIKENYKCLTHG